MDKPEHVKLLEEWMHTYRPQKLFDDDGRLRPKIAALATTGDRRMGANPHANPRAVGEAAVWIPRTDDTPA
jgi:xylulose-5-phosphate/fructose-6-phosphate phosphoketolase